MTPTDRKQFVQRYADRNDLGSGDLARICHVSPRTARSWLDDGDNGRCPGAPVVALLKMHAKLEA